MIERERKFLLNPEWEPTLPIAGKVTIEQGYLMLQNKDQLRVRIVTGKEGGKKGYLCFKRCNTAIERLEFEYQIPMEDAYALMQLAKIKLIKERVTAKTNKYTIDVDFYPDGLKIVEVEFAEGVEHIPDICGDEITGVTKYSNIEIAKKQSNYTTKKKLGRKEIQKAAEEYTKERIVNLETVDEYSYPEVSWEDYYADVLNAFMAGVAWKEKNLNNDVGNMV